MELVTGHLKKRIRLANSDVFRKVLGYRRRGNASPVSNSIESFKVSYANHAFNFIERCLFEAVLLFKSQRQYTGQVQF